MPTGRRLRRWDHEHDGVTESIQVCQRLGNIRVAFAFALGFEFIIGLRVGRGAEEQIGQLGAGLARAVLEETLRAY